MQTPAVIVHRWTTVDKNGFRIISEEYYPSRDIAYIHGMRSHDKVDVLSELYDLPTPIQFWEMFYALAIKERILIKNESMEEARQHLNPHRLASAMVAAGDSLALPHIYKGLSWIKAQALCESCDADVFLRLYANLNFLSPLSLVISFILNERNTEEDKTVFEKEVTEDLFSNLGEASTLPSEITDGDMYEDISPPPSGGGGGGGEGGAPPGPA